MAAHHSQVAVYTGRGQTEQPLIIPSVTAVSMVAGYLFIEADSSEGGHTFSALHRFEPGEWTCCETYN